MSVPDCPKCSEAMDEGFVVDHTYGGHTQAEWVEGPPQRSFWTGLKLGGRTRRPIVTFCCPRCGYLESYAEEGD